MTVFYDCFSFFFEQVFFLKKDIGERRTRSGNKAVNKVLDTPIGEI